MVASHYGLTLRHGLGLEVPPLRSGYQLATFLAARRALATDPAGRDPSGREVWQYDPVARIFEVGRTWIHQLENPAPNTVLKSAWRGRRSAGVLEDSGIPRALWTAARWQVGALLPRLARDPNPLKDELSTPWLFRGQNQSGAFWAVLLTVFVVLCGGWWWPSLRRLKHRGQNALSIRSVQDFGLKVFEPDHRPCLFFVLFLVGLPLFFGLAKLYQFMRDPALESEPFFVVEGISAWPTVWIRIAAILVAVAGYFRTWNSVIAIKDELTVELLPTRPSFDSGFVERAWASFQRGTSWLRVSSFSLLASLVYYRLTGKLFETFGGDVPPVRGERMYLIDRFVLWWSVVLFILLVFVVLRVTVRSTRLIRNLSRATPEDWPEQLGAYATRTGLDPATAAGLMRVRVVQVVGDRIGPCVWWPATVLFLMVLSRANLFDRWSWPAALVLTLTLSFTLLLLSGHGVRLAARRLRDRSLEVLAGERLRRIGQGEERGALEAVMADVRGLRSGVFAPLWEHPLLRAWLLPIAALGANTSMERWLPQLLSNS